MPVTLIGIVSIVRLLTVDMVPIATVGIITIYVSAGTIIAVTIPAIGGVVIAMSAPIVGIVSKGGAVKRSEAEITEPRTPLKNRVFMSRAPFLTLNTQGKGKSRLNH